MLVMVGMAKAESSLVDWVFLSTINYQLSTINHPTSFSVKRRMRPACRIVFRQGSLDAFIPRLAESEGFFVACSGGL